MLSILYFYTPIQRSAVRLGRPSASRVPCGLLGPRTQEGKQITVHLIPNGRTPGREGQDAGAGEDVLTERLAHTATVLSSGVCRVWCEGVGHARSGDNVTFTTAWQ